MCYFIFILTLKLFLTWPMGAPPICHWWLLICPHHLLSTSSLSDMIKYSRLILYLLFPSFGISCFLKEALFPVDESLQNPRSGCQVCILLLPLSGTCSRWGWEIYVNRHTTHTQAPLQQEPLTCGLLCPQFQLLRSTSHSLQADEFFSD